jgi:hypothetical protein
MRFSQQQQVQRALSTDVSEEHDASVFRVEELAEHETRMKQIATNIGHYVRITKTIG